MPDLHSETNLPSAPSSDITVLNINDDQAIRYVLTRMIRSGGSNVLEAATGQEGLERSKTSPDLILLDVQLPDINGIDVCRLIKSDAKTEGIPVIMISATLVRQTDIAKGLLAGAVLYLTHPIPTQDLLSAIQDRLSASVKDRQIN